MFKTTIFTRLDRTTINPFACDDICSYIKGGLIILTQKMFELIGGIDTFKQFKIDYSKLIIVGDITYSLELGIVNGSNILFVENIHEAIKFLSENYSPNHWWFIGDNASTNKFIKSGLIMDIHITKTYSHSNTWEWNYFDQYCIPQSEVFDEQLLIEPNLEFKLVSSVPCGLSKTKVIRHFIRRNLEEINLLHAMTDIIINGFKKTNRTGVNTRSLCGRQFEYKMVERIDPETGKSSYRLPLLTTKRMFTRGVFKELKWFLRGGTNSKALEKDGVNIWKGNTTKQYLNSVGLTNYDEGETGPIYGFQWRHWGALYQNGKNDYTGEGIDQVANVINSLKTDPFSRRHIISAWNVEDIDKMCLPPCHVLYQFLVHEENDQKYLSLMMYQRSCDTFLGLGFNICSLGMFLLMMSHQVNMKPHRIIHSVCDLHIYETHVDAVTKQIQRTPCMFPYISINCEPKEKIEDYEYSDLLIEDYYHHAAIKADMVA